MILLTGSVSIIAVFILFLLVSFVYATDESPSQPQSLAELFNDYRLPDGPTPVRIGLLVEEITLIDQIDIRCLWKKCMWHGYHIQAYRDVFTASSGTNSWYQ